MREKILIIRWAVVSVGLCLLALPVDAQSTGPIKRVESFEIKGAVEHPRTFVIANLQAKTATTQDISQKTGKGTMTGKFTGVLLWTLLQDAGIKTTQGLKNDIIRHTVLITASDGYSTLLSTGELDPEFGGEPAMIAYAKDDKPLEDRDGFAKLLILGDKSAGRAISGVVSIEVR